MAARARGLTEKSILFGHTLRSAAPPIVTITLLGLLGDYLSEEDEIEEIPFIGIFRYLCRLLIEKCNKKRRKMLILLNFKCIMPNLWHYHGYF